jgi:hypothetical protein
MLRHLGNKKPKIPAPLFLHQNPHSPRRRAPPPCSVPRCRSRFVQFVLTQMDMIFMFSFGGTIRVHQHGGLP